MSSPPRCRFNFGAHGRQKVAARSTAVPPSVNDRRNLKLLLLLLLLSGSGRVGIPYNNKQCKTARPLRPSGLSRQPGESKRRADVSGTISTISSQCRLFLHVCVRPPLVWTKWVRIFSPGGCYLLQLSPVVRHDHVSSHVFYYRVTLTT